MESGNLSGHFPLLFYQKEIHFRECRPMGHTQTEPLIQAGLSTLAMRVLPAVTSVWLRVLSTVGLRSNHENTCKQYYLKHGYSQT